MKKTFLFLLLPLMAIIFNSCSKGEDDSNTYVPKYDKLVKTIANDSGSVEFEYDDKQRITKVIWKDETENSDLIDTYAYLDFNNSVIVDNKWGYRATFTFDNNGFVIEESGNNYARHQYSNGYIEGSRWHGAYTWVNGNLTKIVSNIGDTRTYTYNNLENKLSVNIFDIDGFGIDYMIFDNGDTFTNFEGSFPKNYPVTATIGDNTTTFSYTYDLEGYPTKMVVNKYDPLEGIKIITYTISYY